MKAVAEEMGLGFLGIGFHPKWPTSSIPVMPKVYPLLTIFENIHFHGNMSIMRMIKNNTDPCFAGQI